VSEDLSIGIKLALDLKQLFFHFVVSFLKQRHIITKLLNCVLDNLIVIVEYNVLFYPAITLVRFAQIPHCLLDSFAEIISQFPNVGIGRDLTFHVSIYELAIGKLTRLWYSFVSIIFPNLCKLISEFILAIRIYDVRPRLLVQLSFTIKEVLEPG